MVSGCVLASTSSLPCEKQQGFQEWALEVGSGQSNPYIWFGGSVATDGFHNPYWKALFYPYIV